MNKILIVDDSSTMRMIIRRVLRQANVEAATILEASNGVEGLAKLTSDPDIQLIFSDVNMPEMNGIDMVKAVRAQRDAASLPIVMVTTEGSDTMVQKAIESGANAYVTKPFTPESFQAALKPLGIG